MIEARTDYRIGRERAIKVGERLYCGLSQFTEHASCALLLRSERHRNSLVPPRQMLLGAWAASRLWDPSGKAQELQRFISFAGTLLLQDRHQIIEKPASGVDEGIRWAHDTRS